jgi:hypothetical protein
MTESSFNKFVLIVLIVSVGIFAYRYGVDVCNESTFFGLEE